MKHTWSSYHPIMIGAKFARNRASCLGKQINMWKVNNTNLKNNQRTNFNQKSSLEPLAFLLGFGFLLGFFFTLMQILSTQSNNVQCINIRVFVCIRWSVWWKSCWNNSSVQFTLWNVCDCCWFLCQFIALWVWNSKTFT